MLEGSGEEIEITSTADSSTTLQHNSAKAETISTTDVEDSGNKTSKAYREDRTFSLIYPDNQDEPVVLYNSDGSQCIPENLHHNGDDEMLRRYLQDTVQYNDSREISDSSQEVYEHFLFSNATESSYRSENDGTDNYENMDETGCDDYVGHEVGVPKTLTKGIDLDEDFNSSDSFASTESIIPKKIQCPKCPKRFMFKADLKRHDKYKHLRIIDSYFCRYCKKAFDTKEFLKSHEQVHLKRSKNSNRFRCEYCKKTYKNPGNLSYHLKRCSGFNSSK